LCTVRTQGTQCLKTVPKDRALVLNRVVVSNATVEYLNGVVIAVLDGLFHSDARYDQRHQRQATRTESTIYHRTRDVAKRFVLFRSVPGTAKHRSIHPHVIVHRQCHVAKHGWHR